MATVTRPFILSPEEAAELEQKIADAERSTAKSAVPGTVVDLFAWLRSKLDAASHTEPIELDPEVADELERALSEADEDLEHGRHVPREAVFPRSRFAG
jgi:hypothetical protein